MKAVNVIYVGANISGIAVMSVEGMARAENFGSDLATAVFGPTGGMLLSIAILVSIAGVICTNMLTIPRIFFTMAREKLLYAPVGRVHIRFRTPAVAILIPATIGIIMSQLASFRALATYIVIFNQAFFALTAVAVFVLRRKMPDLPRPYRVWGYPFIPLIFIIGVLVVISTEFLNPSERTPLAILGIIIILLGIPVYYLFVRKQSETDRA